MQRTERRKVQKTEAGGQSGTRFCPLFVCLIKKR